MKTRITIGFSLILALMLVVASFSPASAAAGDPASLTGVITAITPGANFVIQLEDTTLVTVTPPAGFDYTLIEVGDTITVNGTEGSEINTIVMADYVIITEEGSKMNGFYCAQSEIQQPAAARLATRFGVEYSVVQQMFCDGSGLGNIMLALSTAQTSGADPATLLDQRSSGMGWGQIWHELDEALDQNDLLDSQVHGNPYNPGNGHQNSGNKNHGKKP